MYQPYTWSTQKTTPRTNVSHKKRRCLPNCNPLAAFEAKNKVMLLIMITAVLTLNTPGNIKFKPCPCPPEYTIKPRVKSAKNINEVNLNKHMLNFFGARFNLSFSCCI